MMIDKQIEMAELLGLKQQQYNRYENETVQPTLDIGLRIAKKLNMHVDEIFYIEEE